MHVQNVIIISIVIVLAHQFYPLNHQMAYLYKNLLNLTVNLIKLTNLILTLHLYFNLNFYFTTIINFPLNSLKKLKMIITHFI